MGEHQWEPEVPPQAVVAVGKVRVMLWFDTTRRFSCRASQNLHTWEGKVLPPVERGTSKEDSEETGQSLGKNGLFLVTSGFRWWSSSGRLLLLSLIPTPAEFPWAPAFRQGRDRRCDAGTGHSGTPNFQGEPFSRTATHSLMKPEVTNRRRARWVIRVSSLHVPSQGMTGPRCPALF